MQTSSTLANSTVKKSYKYHLSRDIQEQVEAHLNLTEIINLGFALRLKNNDGYWQYHCTQIMAFARDGILRAAPQAGINATEAQQRARAAYFRDLLLAHRRNLVKFYDGSEREANFRILGLPKNITKINLIYHFHYSVLNDPIIGQYLERDKQLLLAKKLILYLISYMLKVVCLGLN